MNTTNFKHPLISIIVASYNRGDTLEYTLKSVTKQDYPFKELILIDGGSADKSLNTIKRYKNDIRYWVSEPDRGIAHAWNKGLEQAEGEWICFLGADDVFWDTTVLSRLVPHLIKQPENIRVVYGTLVLLSERHKITNIMGEPWKKARHKFFNGLMIPHVGAMHHQSLFEKRGLFNEAFKIAMDYDLLLRELKHNDAYFVEDLITVGMLESGVSSKPKNRFRTLKEVKKALNENGLKKWSLYTVFEWLKSFCVAVVMRPLLGDRITEKIRNRILLQGKKNILIEIGESRPPFYR